MELNRYKRSGHSLEMPWPLEAYYEQLTLLTWTLQPLIFSTVFSIEIARWLGSLVNVHEYIVHGIAG